MLQSASHAAAEFSGPGFLGLPPSIIANRNQYYGQGLHIELKLIINFIQIVLEGPIKKKYGSIHEYDYEDAC